MSVELSQRPTQGGPGEGVRQETASIRASRFKKQQELQTYWLRMRRTPPHLVTPELAEKLVSLGLFKGSSSKAKDVEEFDTSDDDDFPSIPTKVLTSEEFKARVGICPANNGSVDETLKEAKTKCMRL